MPKGFVQSKDVKTKKIFIGGISTIVIEDEFKDFFSKYVKVVDHEIICDHQTNRSRGFGFIVYENEEMVDNISLKGNIIDLAGTKVGIKKAKPKKASNPPPSTYGSNYRAHSFEDGLGNFRDSYNSFGSGGFGPPYRGAGFGSRLGGYGSYGGEVGEFGGGYGSFGGSSLRGYWSKYSGCLGSYGGGYGVGLGNYGRDEGFGGYGCSSYGGGYDFGPSVGFGSSGPYGSRSGYSVVGRYHPYARLKLMIVCSKCSF